MDFSLQECKLLLQLYSNRGQQSAHVKALVLEKITEIDFKLKKLHIMKKTLKELAGQYVGDEGPGYAIIETLTGKS